MKTVTHTAQRHPRLVAPPSLLPLTLLLALLLTLLLTGGASTTDAAAATDGPDGDTRDSRPHHHHHRHRDRRCRVRFAPSFTVDLGITIPALAGAADGSGGSGGDDSVDGGGDHDAAAAGRGARGGDRDRERDNNSAGPALPLLPLAVSGALSVDGASRRVRVDHFVGGRRRTVLVDAAEGAVYVMEDTRGGGADGAGGAACQRWSIVPSAAPQQRRQRAADNDDDDDYENEEDSMPTLCVPNAAASGEGEADEDNSPEPPVVELVRGVPARRYTVPDAADSALGRLDYYVLHVPSAEGATYDEWGSSNSNSNSNSSGAGASEHRRWRGGEGEGRRTVAVPWRAQGRRVPGAARRELAGAPWSAPNWRFFGGPMWDEVVPLGRSARQHQARGGGGGGGGGEQSGADASAATHHASRAGDGGDDYMDNDDDDGGRAVLPYASSSHVFTVDFYNYLPQPPDPSVLEVPAVCRAANAQRDYRSGGDDGDYDREVGPAVPLRLPAIEHLLLGAGVL